MAAVSVQSMLANVQCTTGLALVHHREVYVALPNRLPVLVRQYLVQQSRLPQLVSVPPGLVVDPVIAQILVRHVVRYGNLARPLKVEADRL